jgi:hypothetical protein
MTVEELIAALSSLPAKARVYAYSEYSGPCLSGFVIQPTEPPTRGAM